MPRRYVNPAVAYYLAPNVVVHHAYKDDDFEVPLEDWFEFDGVEFDCRDWPVEESYASRVGPFKDVPPDRESDAD